MGFFVVIFIDLAIFVSSISFFCGMGSYFICIYLSTALTTDLHIPVY